MKKTSTNSHGISLGGLSGLCVEILASGFNMRLQLLLLSTSLCYCGSATAQFPPGTPYAPPLNYLPNYYNRAQQPLSPYLNMMRGFNPGVNYYYGTRPGTPAGGVNSFGQAPAYNPFVGPAAGGFLPQSSQPNDGFAATYEAGGQPVLLRSAGRQPIVFGNQFLGHGSFLSVGVQGQGRGGQPQQPSQRSTAQGVGTAPPPKK